MNDTDARAWTSLVLLVLGVALYLLINVWFPTEVIAGPIHLGSGDGDCHGLASADHTPYLAFCK